MFKVNCRFSVYGMHSRHMIFDESSNTIISLNKNSNNIVFIDKVTGNKLFEIPYMNVSGCAYEK